MSGSGIEKLWSGILPRYVNVSPIPFLDQLHLASFSTFSAIGKAQRKKEQRRRL